MQKYINYEVGQKKNRNKSLKIISVNNKLYYDGIKNM